MAKKEYREIGIVKALYRYPVKSMTGEKIQESRIGWHGVDADRRYAFLKTNSRQGFPWLTIRDYPELLQYCAYLSDPDDVRNSDVNVVTPHGGDLPVRSAELLSCIQNLSRHPIHLLENWSGVYDAMDISVLTTNSVQSFSSELGENLAIERFRPNILVESVETRAYPEDKWLKTTLAFGDRQNSARIQVNRKTVRCMVINIDPKTTEQNPQILNQAVQSRKNQLGVYASTIHSGTIQVGDVIYAVKE